MTVQNYFEDVDSKPNCIDNVASLRFNQGITVPSPPPRNRLTHSTPHSRSMRDSRNQTCSCICRQKYQSTSFVQLANVVNSPACEVTSCQSAHLCYSNYPAMGSSLSLFIRRRLSSPFIPSRKSLSPLSSIRWSSFLLIIATFFLTFTSHMATAISASVAKSPLTRTDVSNTFDLKTFSGMGPTKSNHKRGSSYKDSRISSRVATHSLDKVDFRLDFQTLKVIKKWGNATRDVLLVAGRDYIYMINATVASNNRQIQYIERLKWASPPGTKSACQLMGKHKHECNNFLRIVELQDDGRLYVCGTDSYEPKCRYYSRDQFSSSSSDPAALHEEACHGQCECPYNPSKSSVHLYTNTSTGDRLFSAVINDFMGNNPVLMRKDTPIVYSVEKWFKDPTFIKMVESDDGKVYLFFRETATSLETGSSTPATYARVAQICKNDTGGTTVLTYQWTTFVKARMKCSIPDSASGMGFNFDNLTSVSEITRIVGQDGRPMDVVFATFTTPWDWDAVAMSAVCVYSMDTIKNLFEFGGFAGEEELRSGLENTDSVDPTEDFETLVKVVRVPHYEVPNPRPGKCPRPGFPVSDKTLYFAKEHFLMYDPVTSLHQQPMYISESDVRATQVAVDNNAGDGQSLIVYFGTEDGRIFRLRPRLQASSGPQSLLLEEKRIADKQECSSGSSPCGVLALHVSRPAQANSESFNQEANLKPTIFVAFTNRMTQLPLAVCKQYGNEKCCNIDPDCGWYDGICVQRTWHNQDQLPPVSNMTEIPSDCQAISSTVTPVPPKSSPVSPTDPGDDDLGAAGSSELVLVAILSFVLGVLVTLALIFLVHRHRQHKAMHNVTKPSLKYFSKSTEDLNDPEIGSEQGKTTPYLVIGSRGQNAPFIDATCSTAEEIAEKKRCTEYVPLTPTSDQDKEFKKDEDSACHEKPSMEQEDGDEEIAFIDSDVSAPLLRDSQETHLIDDINATLAASKLDKSPEPAPGQSQRDVSLNLPGSPKAPPKLPPKQSSSKKTSRPPSIPVTPAPSDSPSNSNNNNSSVKTIHHSPPATSAALPPPPPLPVDEEKNKEKPNETISRAKFPASKSPPPKKPPPPRRKPGLKKHETFSAPHSKKIKPPVPPKSSSVMRSSSMRLPPTVNLAGVQSRTSKDDQVGYSSLPRTDENDLQNLGKVPLIRRGRTPSYKRNSTSRPTSKGLVAVATPIVPQNPSE